MGFRQESACCSTTKLPSSKHTLVPHPKGRLQRTLFDSFFAVFLIEKRNLESLSRTLCLKLKPPLICFQVNCRRAAAAAFQEAVGRQGNFAHGIEIVQRADYFSLGTRAHAYKHVAPFVAQFEEYRQPLIDHVMATKINHWVRE